MNLSFGLYVRLRPNVTPAKGSGTCRCKLYLLMSTDIYKSQMYLYVHQYLHAAYLDAAATEWKFLISKITAGCNQL